MHPNRQPDLLRKIPLLNLLSEQDRQQLAREVVETHDGKHECIFREGDPAEYFYIVKEGGSEVRQDVT